jgi:hypothetical protein
VAADRIEVTQGAYSGVYEFDIEQEAPTGDELHQIKVFSGVRANEVGEAMRAGDYDLVCILAAIAMQRAGRFQTNQVLQVAAALRKERAGFIKYVAADEEEEEGADPPSAPNAELASSNADGAKPKSSGLISENGSENPAETHEPTGVPV